MKEGRSDFKILTGKPTGNILLGRPRRTWDNSSIIYLKEIESIREIGFIQLRIEINGESL